MQNKNSIHPHVTVLLCSFNGEKFIKKQIQSILNQKDVTINLCVHDDYSTDKTVEIVKLLGVDYVKQAKAGGAGRNFIKSIAEIKIPKNANFVALADQDDIWHTDKLSKQIQHMQNTEADLCTCDLICFWESGKTKRTKNEDTPRKFDYLFQGAGNGCTYVLSRKAFLHIQKIMKYHLDSKCMKNFWWHDWLVYILIRAANFKWSHCHEPLVFYRQHANNDFGHRSSFYGMKKRAQMLFSGWYASQVFLAVNVFETVSGEPLPNSLFSIQNLALHSRRSFYERNFLIVYKLFGYFK